MRKTFAMAALLACAGVQAQMTPIGLWQSIDDGNGQPKAEISIVQAADGRLLGKVERSLVVNSTSDPLCVLCTDDRKNQPKVGLEIIRGGKKAEGKDVWEDGKILDPESGRNYTLRLTPKDGGSKLDVRGSVLGIGRTQTWVRVK